MTFDPKALGARLREARENLGISQQTAADVIGVPRTAITHIESGSRSLSTLELTELAKLYQRPVGQLLDPNHAAAAEDPLVVLFRMVPGLEDNPEFRDRIAQYIELCREGRSLESLLGRGDAPPLPEYELPSPRSTSEAVSQGQRAAEDERKRLALGDQPIADFADLLSSQGIWASSVSMPDEVSGLFVHHKSIGMMILVNRSHPRGRKRFSYAHEYAHALFDRRRSVTVTSRGNSDEMVEKRANAFAAAFLMPAGGIESELLQHDKGQPTRSEVSIFDVAREGAFESKSRHSAGSQVITYRDAAMLAAHFKASYMATVYRLQSLGWINAAEGQALLQQEDLAATYLELLKLDVKVTGREPDQVPDRELRSHVLHLAFEAFGREEISKGRLLDLAKLLGINERLLRDHEQAAQSQ